jgi:hypothetical protein
LPQHLAAWERVGSEPPSKRDLSSDQAYLNRREGGSSGPQRPLCEASRSWQAVGAETLCLGPHPDPQSPPASLVYFFLISHCLHAAPYLSKDPRDSTCLCFPPAPHPKTLSPTAWSNHRFAFLSRDLGRNLVLKLLFSHSFIRDSLPALTQQGFHIYIIFF